MLLQITILAAVTERLWECIQQAMGEHNLTPAVKIIGAAVIAVAASISLGLDLFHALELWPKPTVPGIVFTGFLVAGGSNLLHDLVDLVGGLSRKASSDEDAYGGY
jgi:hypothetical protein